MAMALVIILALVIAVAGGCGESPKASEGPLTLTEADGGMSFTIKAGDTILVVLPGNPSTGYSWMAALDEQSAAVLAQQGEPAYVEETTDESVIGGGGTFTFTFTATEEGEAIVKLDYVRPWESVAPEKTFEVNVTVD